LIVGGGAAGCAAAWSLRRFPEKFEVQLWEKETVAGGQATSENIDKVNSFINDGVQGGPYSYRNTLALHKILGFEPQPVNMKISFGKGESNWTNYSKTKLVEDLQSDIKRFGTVLKWINRFEIFFVFLPIHRVLSMCRFSDDFINLMLLPLVALFFGTGNQTPYVSSAMIARVFLDPDLRIFDYDPELLLSQQPEMFSFQKLSNIYEKLSESMENSIFLGRCVETVNRSADNGIEVVDDKGKTEIFDRIIYACDAETVIKITTDISWLEKKILGSVKYFDDVTVTHTDEEYMKKYYDIDFENRKDQYLIKTDVNNRKKIEMSFNLSFYQPQLQAKEPKIFQTIFLNENESAEWTKGEIKKEEIVLEKWWHQMSHGWTHYAFFVPFQRLIQGKYNSYIAGSYTLVNTHEIATISGFAAAAALGAPYPFPDDPLAKKQFDTFCNISHGRTYTGNFNILMKTLSFFVYTILFLLAGVVFIF